MGIRYTIPTTLAGTVTRTSRKQKAQVYKFLAIWQGKYSDHPENVAHGIAGKTWTRMSFHSRRDLVPGNFCGLKPEPGLTGQELVEITPEMVREV
jgi:hypothetical protein